MTVAMAAAVVVSTAIVVAYLGFIYWLDRYEREPLWLVLSTFAWGAIGGTCAGCALSVFPSAAAIATFGADTGMFLSTVVVAPLAEEFTKALVFVPLMLSRHIDNETDGLIYGAATGLGFAALENLMYFAVSSSAEEFFVIVFLRTFFTTLVHCISSALIGMALGWARHRSRTTWPIALLVGYVAAVVCHATWNGLATLSDGAGAHLLLIGCALVVGASIMMFVMTQWSLNREHEMLQEYLKTEARRGTLPEAHAQIIPYWTRRRRSGWLPDSIDREAYVKAATLLAFRRYQAEIADPDHRDSYLQDIAHFRSELTEMLKNAPA